MVAGQRVDQFDLKPGDIAVLGHIPVHLVAESRELPETSGEEIPSPGDSKARSMRNLPIRMRDEASFRDLMAEELSKAPWLSLSTLIHAVLLLVCVPTDPLAGISNVRINETRVAGEFLRVFRSSPMLKISRRSTYHRSGFEQASRDQG